MIVVAKGAYIGLSSSSHKIKNIYIGASNIAHKVKAAYIGVSGSARKWWPSGLSKSTRTISHATESDDRIEHLLGMGRFSNYLCCGPYYAYSSSSGDIYTDSIRLELMNASDVYSSIQLQDYLTGSSLNALYPNRYEEYPGPLSFTTNTLFMFGVHHYNRQYLMRVGSNLTATLVTTNVSSGENWRTEFGNISLGARIFVFSTVSGSSYGDSLYKFISDSGVISAASDSVGSSIGGWRAFRFSNYFAIVDIYDNEATITFYNSSAVRLSSTTNTSIGYVLDNLDNGTYYSNDSAVFGAKKRLADTSCSIYRINSSLVMSTIQSAISGSVYIDGATSDYHIGFSTNGRSSQGSGTMYTFNKDGLMETAASTMPTYVYADDNYAQSRYYSYNDNKMLCVVTTKTQHIIGEITQ